MQRRSLTLVWVTGEWSGSNLAASGLVLAPRQASSDGGCTKDVSHGLAQSSIRMLVQEVAQN
jgi:hypothetical protein